MMRRYGWLMLIVLSVALGMVMSSRQVLRADPSAVSADEPVAGQRETVRQLKEIHAQLQDLQTLLCSGKVRVVVVINPDEP
jgi:hypothetical protein